MDDPAHLQQISECLDRALSGFGNHREVAQNYGLHNDEISLVLEENDRSPTTALIQWLAATRPELTVQEFVAVVRRQAKREDVATLLESYMFDAYDSNRLNSPRVTDTGKHLAS